VNEQSEVRPLRCQRSDCFVVRLSISRKNDLAKVIQKSSDIQNEYLFYQRSISDL